MNIEGNFPSYETQQEIKTTVNNIKTTTDSTKISVDQVKQDVGNISTQIANKNTGKVLKSKTYFTSGTFTVPVGVTEVYVTGGGGGGSGGAWGNRLTTTGKAGGITSFGNLLSLPGGTGGVTLDSGSISSVVSLPGGPGGTAGKTLEGACTGGNSGFYSGGQGIPDVRPNSPKAGDGAYCAGGGGMVNGHGGGGGHFVIDQNITVSSGMSYTITIGKGGGSVTGTHSTYPDSPYTSGKGGDGYMIIKWWE